METNTDTSALGARVGRAGDDAEPEPARSDWLSIAHEAQLPPEGRWSTWLFQGGRGAGKTRAGAEWLAARAEASPNGRFALIGATAHDVREVMVEGLIRHCGDFLLLEQEMMAMDPGGAVEGRLDRVDALVWALTKLMAAARLAQPRCGPL